MKKYLILLATIASLSACKKEDQTVTGGEALNKWHEENLVNNYLQTYTINANTGGWVTSEKGMKIYIYPNILYDQSNNLVMGDVTVKLIELYSREDMLLTNKPTVGVLPNGNRAMLVSGGEYYLSIEQGDKKLKSTGVLVQIPVDNTGGIDFEMQMFKGGSNMTTNELVWTLDTTSIFVNEPSEDTSIVISYNFVDNSWGWTNIDRFYDDPAPKTTILVKLPKKYDQENCDIFLTVDSEPSTLAPLDVFTADGYFSEHYGELPIGLDIHLVAVSMDDDVMNYAIKGATIVDGEIITIDELTPITTAELKVLVDNLP
jgi:hypothetical protein